MRPQPPVGLRDVRPAGRPRLVAPAVDPVVQVLEGRGSRITPLPVLPSVNSKRVGTGSTAWGRTGPPHLPCWAPAARPTWKQRQLTAAACARAGRPPWCVRDGACDVRRARWDGGPARAAAPCRNRSCANVASSTNSRYLGSIASAMARTASPRASAAEGRAPTYPLGSGLAHASKRCEGPYGPVARPLVDEPRLAYTNIGRSMAFTAAGRAAHRSASGR
jgi:hypothetical protein